MSPRPPFDGEMKEFPRLYSDLAGWFHLLTPPHEYREEAAYYADRIVEAASSPVQSVLELGSGGGNNAFHMKQRFTIVLSDISPEMIEASRTLNPGLEHVLGDMRSLRIPDRTFDAVFVHDAVSYLTSVDEIHAMAATAAVHCRPQGSVLVAPDHVLETFSPPYTDWGGYDDPDGRGIRYLMWCTDPDPSDTTYIADFAYMLRESDGSLRLEHDRHLLGIFAESVWLNVLEGAGFQCVPQTDPWGNRIFTGAKGTE